MFQNPTCHVHSAYLVLSRATSESCNWLYSFSKNLRICEDLPLTNDVPTRKYCLLSALIDLQNLEHEECDRI